MPRAISHTIAVAVGTFVTLALGTLSSSGLAQQHPAVERGFQQDKLFHFADGNLDAVDTFSGKLSLSIPLGQTYNIGGGTGYSLVLQYSSSLYDFDEITSGGGSSAVRSRPARHFNAGVGWCFPWENFWTPTIPETRRDAPSISMPPGAFTEHTRISTTSTNRRLGSGILGTRRISAFMISQTASTSSRCKAEISIPSVRMGAWSRSGTATKTSSVSPIPMLSPGGSKTLTAGSIS